MGHAEPIYLRHVGLENSSQKAHLKGSSVPTMLSDYEN